MTLNEKKIAILGLGYVGLPLAVEFAKKYSVVGFDINQVRVDELFQGHDSTLEIDDSLLKSVLKKQNDLSLGLYVSNEDTCLSTCNIFIVTVPTPTDKFNRPVLSPMLSASKTVAKYLKKNDIVIYESTVYPGVTEDECVPVLENESKLVYNQDFFCGYSPERINPGDKEHTVAKILKVTSGSTPEVAEIVDKLYKSVITAGTYKASSIKVAEAAKVIENSQRDINIAFVNELSKIFNLLKIDTHEVLVAAGTKWNFLNFKPGLVGGHCIGVDPYYLAQKAQEVGYHPEIILAGRRLNDGMGAYVAKEVISLMIKSDIKIKNSSILILGITFKENCPDIRNTKVTDIYNELSSFGVNVRVCDPWANKNEVKHEYGIDIYNTLDEASENFEAIILAVSHNEFNFFDWDKFKKSKTIIYDVKGVLPKDKVNARL